MDQNRRSFLKESVFAIAGFGCAGGVAAGIARALDMGIRESAKPSKGKSGTRWAMVIDTVKCAKEQEKGCRACVDACHLTHNVPEITDNPRHEVKWIWSEEHQNAFPTQVYAPKDDEGRVSEWSPEALLTRPTMVLCNHCDRPPCVRVCPTQATWKRDDGVVMIDFHRCIGCRYCVVGCPFGARSFNWKDPRDYIDPENLHSEFPTRTKGVAEKCNLCAERLAQGLGPACVEACPVGAMLFGDIADPESEVAQVVRNKHTIRRKPVLGTEPHVFYLV
jgi:molybdopterin-containing oxidoreductase family iron-sulfur binding subunit